MAPVHCPVAETTAVLLLAAAALGCAHLLLSLALLRRARVTGHAPGKTAPEPPLSVLKPLSGSFPGLDDCLASMVTQDYSGHIEVVCGVSNSADPAVANVKALRETGRADIKLVIDGRRHGTNAKVSNLLNMERECSHEILVISDADIVVGRDYAATIAEALDRDSVGAVTFLYRGLAAGGVWSRFTALGINTHFLPNAVVGIALGLATPCFGSTIAIERHVLARSGGLARLADALADDYALGQAVRELGLEVAVAPRLVGHVCAERSFTELWQRELRWARTVRAIDPLGHACSVLAHPFGLSLLAAAACPKRAFVEIALCLCTSALILRAALLRSAQPGETALRSSDLALLPLRDLLSFAVLVWSHAGRRVSWNGHRYRVTPRAGRSTMQAHREARRD